MKTRRLILILLVTLLFSACMSPESAAVLETETPVPKSATSTPPPTLTATASALPPSPTPTKIITPPPGAWKGTIVIRNGTVITAVAGAEPIPNGMVVVTDGLITAVGPESEVQIPAGARILDANGGTILPGLIDMHVHMLNELTLEDGKLTEESIELALQRAIQVGVTMFWDVGSHYATREEIDTLRAEFAALGNTIPTILISGPILAHADGPFAEVFAYNTRGVRTVEEARQAALDLVDAGVDHIKIALNMRPTAQPPVGDPPEEIAPSLTEEQVRAIVEIAHANGMLVTAHVTDPREAEIALAAGVDVFAHYPSSAQPIPDDLLQSIIAAGVPIVSTFDVASPRSGDIRRVLEAGAVILYGSDRAFAKCFCSAYSEFSAMRGAGMQPLEMIRAATALPAQALGLGDRLGTLEVGKYADIIVVGGDVLDDFRPMKDVVFVIKNGELVVEPGDE